MQHFASFAWFVLPAFAIGFFAMSLWWRWWLLVPVTIAAAILGKIEYDSVMASDGPGMALGVGLVVFLLIGAGSGVIASALVIAGRAFRLRILNPVIVLPVVFLVGFGSYFALNWIQKKARQAKYAPPSASCLNGLHPALLGNVELDIPVAPGLFLRGMGGHSDHYMLWGNPDARAFCSDADDGPVTLKEVAFAMSSQALPQTRRPFCDEDHPEYPWASMACGIIFAETFPDHAVQVSVSIPKGNTDWVARSREEMMKNPLSVATDGVKAYRGQNHVYFERPDGFFARCHGQETPSQPWLYCTTQELLPEGLALSFSFRATQNTFLQQSPKAAASAHAVFDSLRRRD